MKTLKQIIEQLTATRESLTNDELTLIDFDKLVEALDNTRATLTAQMTVHEELSLIRQDYEQRIAGMAKAIAMADRTKGGIAESIALVDSLAGLSAKELVACYHRVAARFRDMFPASYTRDWSVGIKPGQVKHPELFK